MGIIKIHIINEAGVIVTSTEFVVKESNLKDPLKSVMDVPESFEIAFDLGFENPIDLGTTVSRLFSSLDVEVDLYLRKKPDVTPLASGLGGLYLRKKPDATPLMSGLVDGNGEFTYFEEVGYDTPWESSQTGESSTLEEKPQLQPIELFQQEFGDLVRLAISYKLHSYFDSLLTCAPDTALEEYIEKLQDFINCHVTDSDTLLKAQELIDHLKKTAGLSPEFTLFPSS